MPEERLCALMDCSYERLGRVKWGSVVRVGPKVYTSVALALALNVHAFFGASAEPVLGIGFRSSLHCADESARCSAVLDGADWLGSKLSVAIEKGSVGDVSVMTISESEHPIEVVFHGKQDGLLTLTWDGDYNPRQLSSAGLNCLDWSGITKFILPVHVDSDRNDTDSNVIMSAAITLYSGTDPTGQRYSQARFPLEDGGFAFSKSEFRRSGIRGTGDFSCVGALSLAIRTKVAAQTSVRFGVLVADAPLSDEQKAIRREDAKVAHEIPAARKTPTLRLDIGSDVSDRSEYRSKKSRTRDEAKSSWSGADVSIEWDSDEEGVLVFGSVVRSQ